MSPIFEKYRLNQGNLYDIVLVLFFLLISPSTVHEQLLQVQITLP